MNEFENGQEWDGSRHFASVHTIPAQFENDRKNFTVGIPLQSPQQRDWSLRQRNLYLCKSKKSKGQFYSLISSQRLLCRLYTLPPGHYA